MVLHADEYLGNVLPWQSLAPLGVETEVLPSRGGRLDVEDLERALAAGRTRVVAVAAVSLATGERRDLGAIGALCRRHGALCCVDAVQALGALAVDVSAVDAVCAAGRKWLLGPPDVGILALRPGLAAELRPNTAGAGSKDGDGSWRPEALRFEGGAAPEVPLAGLAASTEQLLGLGLDAVEARILERARWAVEIATEQGLRVLSPRDERRSGIVWVALPEGASAQAVEERLAAAGVVVGVGASRVRLAPHAWSTEAELERAVACVAGGGA